MILKVEKNRDGKTGKTNLYFDYPRSRILTNEEYMNEFGEVMKILKRVGQLLGKRCALKTGIDRLSPIRQQHVISEPRFHQVIGRGNIPELRITI